MLKELPLHYGAGHSKIYTVVRDTLKKVKISIQCLEAWGITSKVRKSIDGKI